MQKKIAITCGDPSGIGPEILNKIIAEGHLRALSDYVSFTILGLEAPQALLGGAVYGNNIEFLTLPNLPSNPGAVSFLLLKAAIEACMKGEFHGLVTGPISKENWANDGFKYKGQTELLGEMTYSKPEMLFATTGDFPWRVLLLTRHLPIKEVPEALTFARFEEAVASLKNFFKEKYKIENPKIALAGLNPHAGENGEIGLEEKLFWKDWAVKLGLSGPFSPDDIWYRAGRAYLQNQPQEFDVYLAPYHDQALPLIKTITNFQAVNVSIGLPFVRTSPDHGTAFNLVGTGRADIQPFLEAIRLCVELS